MPATLNAPPNESAVMLLHAFPPLWLKTDKTALQATIESAHKLAVSENMKAATANFVRAYHSWIFATSLQDALIASETAVSDLHPAHRTLLGVQKERLEEEHLSQTGKPPLADLPDEQAGAVAAAEDGWHYAESVYAEAIDVWEGLQSFYQFCNQTEGYDADRFLAAREDQTIWEKLDEDAQSKRYELEQHILRSMTVELISPS